MLGLLGVHSLILGHRPLRASRFPEWSNQFVIPALELRDLVGCGVSRSSEADRGFNSPLLMTSQTPQPTKTNLTPTTGARKGT